jgi:hypothetical protein
MTFLSATQWPSAGGLGKLTPPAFALTRTAFGNVIKYPLLPDDPTSAVRGNEVMLNNGLVDRQHLRDPFPPSSPNNTARRGESSVCATKPYDYA